MSGWGDGDGDGGDGGGWGETQDGGDWGEKGGDDWGTADDSGWGATEEAKGNDEELSPEVQIENAFYEADDLRLENPKQALESFQQVIELAKKLESLNDKTLGCVFRSLRHIVSLHFQAGSFAKMREAYAQLFEYIPRVTRNEAQEAVNAVLHDVEECKDQDFVNEIYKLTMQTVKKLPDQERLWFRVAMRYCELCYRRGDVKECQLHLDELLKSCQNPDGSDDPSKSSELLEIYALDSRMSITSHDTVRLKALYEKTKNLQAAVKDPKSQSVIRECWGQMFGDQGLWSRAYSEFYSAFNSYQEIGERDKAKQCLKYVVIANMLSGGTSNPFDAREAKAFQTDKDIQALGDLRNAFEKCVVSKFTAALKQILQDGDPFVAKHLHVMVKDFHGRAIVQLIKSYRRVRLDFLADALAISQAEVEALLVQLVFDGKVVGRIDQVSGVLDLSQSGAGGGAKYKAIHGFVTAIADLRRNLPVPQGSPI